MVCLRGEKIEYYVSGEGIIKILRKKRGINAMILSIIVVYPALCV
jgi:hypothetical protein